MSTEDRNYCDINRALVEGSQVAFISSYPRSGNTWVRFLLSDVFLQRAGIATGTTLPVLPSKVVPDIYVEAIAERETQLTPGLVVKTHEGYQRLAKHLPAEGLRKCRHVYIFRTPEDALMSFYRYHLRHEQLKGQVRRGKDHFCRTRVREWVSNAGSYLHAAREGSEVYFVSYESLLDRTVSVLSGVLDWLGVDCPDTIVQQAVLHMEFDKMVSREERGHPENGEFTGRGRPGAGVAELQAETLDIIHQEAADTLSRLNGLLSQQNEAMPNEMRVASHRTLAQNA